MRARSVLLAVTVLLCGAPPARATDKEAVALCVEAHSSAQQLRGANKLTAARKELLKCSLPECPGAVRNDCATWIGDLQTDMPSLVIAATDAAGSDVLDVRVLVDGVLLAEQLSDRALQVDPGQHTLRFERAGSEPVERPLLLRVGERNRRVLVSFKPSTTGAPVPGKAAPSPEADTSRPVPAATWILGGVGVVGLAGFGYFTLDGSSKHSDLDKCRPGCATSDVDAARRSYLIGDISLAVGVLSLGGAAYFLFTRPSAKSGRAEPSLMLSAGASPQAGFAGVRGRF